MNRIVIFSPSQYSLYSICVTELLRRNGVEIQGVFVRKLINPQRLLSEFGRDGSRLFKKIWNKLILRQRGYTPRSYPTMADLIQQEKIDIMKIDEFETKYAIPVTYCSDLNDPHVENGLRSIKPDLVVFTGGGLIRETVLSLAGAGVLNCHLGVLPDYRGMDVVEWPILERRYDRVGMTVHFMDRGLDTGDILRIQPLTISPGDNIQQIRGKAEPIMCQTMVNTCRDYLAGKLERHPQSSAAGKQYFIMHPRLIAIAANNLKSACG
jgi:methionyl-tRNA formyltransferase